MDAIIYQIIFGELGDLNCSLIDALQDTFMENASLSLQSIDGKMMNCFIFSIFFKERKKEMFILLGLKKKARPPRF